MRRWFLLWLVMTGACVPVPAWQRGDLADRRLQVAPQPERDGARRHVFSVREGALGGQGLSGGGCGCD